jgi:hypothetical protein
MWRGFVANYSKYNTRMNADRLKENCSVIMASCSGYRDVWKAFFTLFFEFWSDCPFDVYLVSDSLGYDDSRVNSIVLARDEGWSANMRAALASINTPYFILFVEDFLLLEQVDTNRIKNLLDYAIQNNLDYLRLYPTPGPDKNFDISNGVGEIALDAPYRLSLMTAIWRKETFLRVLKDNENAWELELNGSERVRDPKYKFWSVLKGMPALNYFSTALKKGVWLFDAVKLCEKHGVQVDGNLHAIESYSHYLMRKLKTIPGLGRVVGFVARRLASH